MDNEQTNGSKNKLPHPGINDRNASACKRHASNTCCGAKRIGSHKDCTCTRVSERILNDPVAFNELFRSL